MNRIRARPIKNHASWQLCKDGGAETALNFTEPKQQKLLTKLYQNIYNMFTVSLCQFAYFRRSLVAPQHSIDIIIIGEQRHNSCVVMQTEMNCKMGAQLSHWQISVYNYL